MVDHAEGTHAGKGGHLHTNTCKYTHARTHAHTNTHTHHPEVVYDWEVIKEAQRSVKVKGERSNQPGEVNHRLREGQHLHTWLWAVCVCRECVCGRVRFSVLHYFVFTLGVG